MDFQVISHKPYHYQRGENQRRLDAGQWFSSGPPVSSTNKTDLHVIAEILLKMALDNIALILTHIISLSEIMGHDIPNPNTYH